MLWRERDQIDPKVSVDDDEEGDEKEDDEEGYEKELKQRGRGWEDPDHMQKVCEERDANDNLKHLTFLFSAYEPVYW